MANILVTGANGQLGSELRKIGFSILDEVFFTDVDELDITNLSAIESFVTRNDIDTIINCAAYTNVEKAEEDEALATKINTSAVENLAKIAEKESCLLIHVSTDYVFNGTAKTPYTEKEKASPIGVYGRTKWTGEQAILDSGCMYIIIRTAWLYSEFGNNFVKTMLRLGSERSEIKVVNDQIGSPTFAEDLAQAIISIMDNDERIEYQGIYHFTDEGVCSWYDFASEIIRSAGLNCQVKPISSSEYPSKVTRPAYSVLDKSKIKNTFNVDIPDWKPSLERCLKLLKAI